MSQSSDPRPASPELVQTAARASSDSRQLDPRKLDLFELTRNARVLSGSVGVQQLPRMSTEIPTDAPERDTAFEWRAEGSMQSEFSARGARGGVQTQPFLRLVVQGSVWLTCQRCLAPCPQRFDIDVLLHVAADEAEADEAPLDDDGPDVIVGSRQFDLLELVEEELLLALPLVPKHEICPRVHEALASGAAGDVGGAGLMNVPDASNDPRAGSARRDAAAHGAGSTGAPAAERQHPFSGLAALRKKSDGSVQ